MSTTMTAVRRHSCGIVMGVTFTASALACEFFGDMYFMGIFGSSVWALELSPRGVAREELL
jgi:hypothetical protein